MWLFLIFRRCFILEKRGEEWPLQQFLVSFYLVLALSASGNARVLHRKQHVSRKHFTVLNALYNGDKWLDKCRPKLTPYCRVKYHFKDVTFS